MTPALRLAGIPSPLAAQTHDDEGLRPPIPFDPAQAGAPELDGADAGIGDPFAVSSTDQLPPWLAAMTRSIRPVCVGALMAIPTIGTATVGAVAIVDHQAALHAVDASTRFLAGIPGDIVALIGVLATGYSLSKTVERLKGKRA